MKERVDVTSIEVRKPKLKVTAVCQKFDGTAFYRVINPANLLSEHNIDINYVTALHPGLIKDCDVLLIQRVSTHPDILVPIKTARDLGKKVIYDIDDAIWDIPFGYKFYESGEDMLGKKEFVYQTVQRICHAVNYVTVSTEELLNAGIACGVISEWVERKVLPNFTPLKCDVTVNTDFLGNKLLLQTTHDHQLYDIDPIREIDIKDYTLAIFGLDELQYLNDKFKMKTEYHKPVTFNFYPTVMSRINAKIGLAPLNPCLMVNQCKSVIKILEYAMFGMSVVVSPVGEYGLCTPAYFANFNKKAWENAIVRVIAEPNADAVKEWATKWDEDAKKKWIDFYKSFIKEE